MGKTARWFRSLLGYKKQPSDSQSSKKEENKRGTVRSSNDNERSVARTKGYSVDFPSSSSTGNFIEGFDFDPTKHAIAVAAATAAVAEAAIAAAKAAAEVVRLTGGGSRSATPHVVNGGGDWRRELAAVKIQSAFRAYLARRALRALKGLVRLQALVRGRIVRKQSADMLRRMQAMVRIQARASANRAYMLESSHSSSKSFQSHNPRCGLKPNIKDNVGLERMHMNSNWLDRRMEETTCNSDRDKLLRNGCVDDEKVDKILEIDTWKPHLCSKRNDLEMTSQHVSAWQHNGHTHTFDYLPRHSTKLPSQNPGLFSKEVSSLRLLKLPPQLDQGAVWTADNSPQIHTASSRPGSSSRRGPFTPVKAEYAQSFFGDYISHPNYMANTESSKAKIRSQSAPRQRIQFERPASTKRFIYGLWDADSNSERGSTTHASFMNKAYPSSVHLKRPGTPGQSDAVRYSSTYGGRF